MKHLFKYIIVALAIVLLISLVLSFNPLNFFKGVFQDSITESESNSTISDSSNIPESDSIENVDSSEESESVDAPNNEMFEGLTYVAFGDSITYGADYTRNYSQMDFPYPTLVAESLELSSVSNKAISGATLCTNDMNLVCMTNNILAYTEQADIISVMLGVNDYNRSLPLGDIDDKTKDTVYGSLNLIAEHLTTTQEDAFIFFMTPYKCKVGSRTYKDKNDAGYVLEDVANAVKEVANKYNIPVLDMFNEGQYELEMYNYGSDGIHPSQEFIREYTAPQIAEFIRQNYRGK